MFILIRYVDCKKNVYRFFSGNYKVYIILLLYSETLNNEYIERIHQMSYSSLSDNGMLQIFSFLLNDYMELFKTVPAYS